MRCPECGAWNAAYLPNCTRCGAPLPENSSERAAWEDALHDKKPSLRITKYDEDDPAEEQQPAADAPYDPETVDASALTDEVEELMTRRQRGEQRLNALRERASDVRRALRETEVIRPHTEDEDESAPGAREGGAAMPPVRTRSGARREILVYADDDPDAPVYHDGYVPEGREEDAGEDDEYLPRRVRRSAGSSPSIPEAEAQERKKKSTARTLLRVFLVLLVCALVAVGSVLAARFFVIRQGVQMRRDNSAYAECIETEVDGRPAHTIVVHGRENATVYLRETSSTYVVADGSVSVTIPDYMWYDTDSSTYATPVDTDTMDVTVSPFIRYSQEGEQYEIEPLHFTIDVPESPVYLLNPATPRAEVGVSIFEVRINVPAGSTVVIDGTNVSTLIRETGNVSKNVQVLPVGDNTISISVKSKYCRETKMEVVLYRAPQEIPLELVPTVITEWNYEADDPVNQASISGSTLPGATITVESPHENLEVNQTTGDFKFKPLFPLLGNNEVVIRSSYEGRADSVITHTVYYMPTADVYTRRAWDLDSQYSDLINYINIRKGTIYVGTGVIKRIISSTPQLAVMDIGNENFEKLVLLENSSKTTWMVGTKYRIYGEAFGLYDTMPRLTVRYTYLME